MSIFGKHTKIPPWLLPAGIVTGSAVLVGGIITGALLWQGPSAQPTAQPEAATTTVTTTTTTDTTDTTTTTAETTVTTTTTTTTTTKRRTTTTTTRRTTTTTKRRTTIPSIKPPTVQTEPENGGLDRPTTASTARATAAQNSYKPVRPDRVCLPDLPHLYGSTGKLVGIDVSRSNGDIDWPAVKAAGIRFAIIRCGYRTYGTQPGGGTIYEDANFKKNIQGALDAGIEVGVYFFSAAKNRAEALEEAAFTLEAIKGYDVTWPVAFDFEIFGQDRVAGVSAATVTDNAIAFMDYVAQFGYTPMLYSSRNMLRDDFHMGRLREYRVWLAQYAELSIKSYGGEHAIWQCASDGLVDGIKSHVDLNIAYEDLSKPHTPLLTPPPMADTFEGFSFADAWDRVELKGAYNLRLTPHTESPNIVTTGKKGLTLTRTGVDAKAGWSRVLYDGQTVYVVSEALTYLGTETTTTTTTAPPTTASESVTESTASTASTESTASTDLTQATTSTESVVSTQTASTTT